jgi:hypothetical protein
MNRRHFLSLTAAGATVASAQPSSSNGVSLRVAAKGTVHNKSSALIAGNCRCANGDLLVAANTGGDLSPGQRALLVRSTDGARTWGPVENEFRSMFVRGGIEAGCSLTRISSGRLLLPYADGFYLHPKGKNYDRHALLFCPTSDDNGRTWQNTKAQPYEGLEAFAFGRVVELSSGTLLLPLWGSYDRQGAWGAGLVKSTDGGANWGDWRSIVREHGDETPIVLLPDGRILALIRGYTPQDRERPFHVAHSGDGGDTWTPPAKVNLYGTSPGLHITPKGRLLAGYRSTLKGANVHIASSADSGLTWKFELEVQLPSGEWDKGGYPAFENLADGRIFVTFHNAQPGWHVDYNILEEIV